MPYGLSKLVNGINAAPQILTSSVRDEQKTKNPSNFISGLGYGTYAIAKGVFDGVTGIVTEPVKGARNEGFKGAAKGLASGLIGIVAKPVAGTVGFV